jgi:hypothetical protein
VSSNETNKINKPLQTALAMHLDFKKVVYIFVNIAVIALVTHNVYGHNYRKISL